MFSFKSALTNKDPEHTAAVKKEVLNALGEISSHLHSTFLDGKDQGKIFFNIRLLFVIDISIVVKINSYLYIIFTFL